MKKNVPTLLTGQNEWHPVCKTCRSNNPKRVCLWGTAWSSSYRTV